MAISNLLIITGDPVADVSSRGWDADRFHLNSEGVKIAGNRYVFQQACGWRDAFRRCDSCFPVDNASKADNAINRRL
jgi:hypothetical protein